MNSLINVEESNLKWSNPEITILESQLANKIATLLQSAQAKIVSRNGRSEQARVLFDSCSQKSFINESLSHKLNLPIVRKERIILKAFESQKEKLRTLVVVQARVFCINQPDFVLVEVELYVVPKICSPISCQEIELAQATYEHLVELKLADSTNGSSEIEIDALIGGDSYWCFMTGEMKRGRDGPVALKTILGWVLSGAYHNDSNSVGTNVVSSHVLKLECRAVDYFDRDREIVEHVNKFWDIET